MFKLKKHRTPVSGNMRNNIILGLYMFGGMLMTAPGTVNVAMKWDEVTTNGKPWDDDIETILDNFFDAYNPASDKSDGDLGLGALALGTTFVLGGSLYKKNTKPS